MLNYNEKDLVDVVTATTHLQELALKDPAFKDSLLAYHREAVIYAEKTNVKLSKLNPNDILNSIHSRTQFNADNNTCFDCINGNSNVRNNDTGVVSNTN